MIPFNYHHLYYFYVIAREGSMSKAAKILSLGQPTLSTQLKQFESYFSVKLFEREGKRLRLTEEGRYVLSYAQQIFDLGREFVDGMSDRSKPGQLQIQIGALITIPKSFLENMLKIIFRIHPNVYVSLHEDDAEKLVDGIRSHLFDFVLMDVPLRGSPRDEIQNYEVGRHRIVFCANPELAKKYRHLPQDLNNAPMILPTEHSQDYHAVQEYFAKHRITPKIIAEIQDVEVARRMTCAGIGIAPLNELNVHGASADERLVILDKNAKHPIQDVLYLITKKRKKPHPLTQKIINELQPAHK
ncbi:MAG: LysR family transcriptional regulator [Candidatus Omnitrophota bacterium]